MGLREPERDLPWVLREAETAASANERVLALAELVAWVRGPAYSPVNSDPEDAIARLRLLVGVLENHANPRAIFAGLMGAILRHSESPSLFAETELNEQGGLFSEIVKRTADQALPPGPRPHELGYALEIAFSRKSDSEWTDAISEDDWIRLCTVIGAADTSSLFDDLRDSALNVAVQAAAIGLSSEVRARADAGAAAALSRAASRWRDSLAERETREFAAAIERSRASVESAYASIEARGVSLSLVYRLETLSTLLRRLELILRVIELDLDRRERLLRARELFQAVVRARLARKSVRALLAMNFDIFARRLVQHAGETGEHYIARDRAELRAMLIAGAGGGFVTVGTCLLKLVGYGLHLPLFFGGLFFWADYAGSFILMQLMGFSLATKQPSMTSAALADKLSREMDPSKLESFVEEIATISRSQVMAALGNVGFVIPGALIACLVFERVARRPMMSLVEAQHMLDTLHPWRSGTLAYAALTGVLLWLSSFGAGWVQNWIIYRSLPQALENHRGLRALFGPAFARGLGKWTRRNASGIGGNLAIGFLLAFVPIAGSFFGLPLDVRHVTLSAGTLSIAFRSLGAEALDWHLVGTFALSVLAIGVLNFGVSTACALAVAARARRVRRAWLRAVVWYAWRAFLRRPWRFVLPPREMA